MTVALSVFILSCSKYPCMYLNLALKWVWTEPYTLMLLETLNKYLKYFVINLHSAL